jgi:hypothetical protein
MSSEIDNLINMALADGEVTEKERAIVLRKAEALGLDKDEVEMILDGRIALQKKQDNLNQQKPLSNKEGDLKKCPSCGSGVISFSTKCEDCGHEFRNISSSNTIQKLFTMLNDLEGNRDDDKPNLMDGLGNIFGQAFGMKDKIESQKKELIANFPVPNTKEDIIEFLALALPKTKKMGFFTSDGFTRKAHNEMAAIWEGKCHQIIMKARFAMKEDKSTLAEIEQYAKQLGIK